MARSHIYKDIMTGDVIYSNNKGEEFVLMETTSPIGGGRYDIVTAFKLTSEGYSVDSPVWWYGAYEIERYFDGKSNDLLPLCKTYLDEHNEKELDPVDQFYFVLEEALDAACGVMQLNLYEDYTDQSKITWDHVETMRKIRDIFRQAEADATPLMNSIPTTED